MAYTLIRDEEGGLIAIRCLECGGMSFHPNDIEQKYCGHCHKFHEDDTQ